MILLPCTTAAFAELSTDLLSKGISLRFQAHGSSMQPLVRDGDTLLVQPVKTSSVNIGDVVLCTLQPCGIVVHRVLQKRSEAGVTQFLIQGDQVASPDGWIPEDMVFGRLVSIEREGRVLAMDSPVMSLLGWMALLRSRWGLGSGSGLRSLRQWVKCLPVFLNYLT